MAQRLVRKLCQKCKKEVHLEGVVKDRIEKIALSIQDKSYSYQLEKMWTAVGCADCNSTGYKGRIGVYEAIYTDAKIEEVVNQNPSEHEIQEAALPQGLLNMSQDGILKILHGITSLEEVERVIDLGEALS